MTTTTNQTVGTRPEERRGVASLQILVEPLRRVRPRNVSNDDDDPEPDNVYGGGDDHN